MSESTSPEVEPTAGLADEIIAAHQAEQSLQPWGTPPPSTFYWMLQLALPVLLEEGLNLLVSLTDRFLAGWYLGGPEPQAAMGLMMYAFWMMYCIFSAIAIGSTALIARFVGARELPLARHAVGQAIFAGAVLSVLVTILAYFGNAKYVEVMGLTGEAAELATRYLWYVTPVIPIMMLEQVGSACLRGAGDTVTGLVARVVVNIVNAILSLLFVTGWLGFPQLGFEGLALGTAIGHAFGGLIILAALYRGRKGLSLENRHLVPDFGMLQRLLRVGIPGGIDMLLMVGCHLIYLRIITSLGMVALAAHGLGVQIEAISFLSGSAFQVAAATMAGQSLGAKDPARAMRSVLIACGGAICFMCTAGIVFYFEGESIAMFFTGGRLDETSLLSGKLLKIVALAVAPMAILIVFSGAMRGAGDTRFTLILNFVGVALIRLPLSALLGWSYIQWPVSTGESFHLELLGWGVEGVWWAMVVDVVIRCVVITWRFFRGDWLKVQV